MQRNPLLITDRLRTRSDLYHALSAIHPTPDAPVPTNLDAMADLIRECGITHVVCADWELPPSDTQSIAHTFEDLGVHFSR